jgi:hypothetical protein
MRQLSRRAAVGLELLVLPERSEGDGVHGLTAAFSPREARGEWGRVEPPEEGTGL